MNLPDSANATAQAQADAMQQETETVALDSKNRYAERRPKRAESADHISPERRRGRDG